MAEVIVSFTEATRADTGDLYYGRALGRVTADGLWEGWLEFTLAGTEESVMTSRETTQPNRADLKYWAQGLTAAYLEGALSRALHPTPVLVPAAEQRVFVDASPRENPRPAASVGRNVVLDPFLTYAEGEQLLRRQLHALSRDHLQNIIEAYRFAGADEPDWARIASQDALVERIVERVRARFAATESGRTEPGAEAGRQSATAEDRSA